MADPASVVGVISGFRTEHGISHRVSCRAPGVSESWFYKHHTHQPTRRELRRQHLIEVVKGEFDDSGGTYGSPKIWIRLVRQGWRISVNTIAKIMAELGLVARKVRRRRGLTRPGKRSAALDFVRRDFTAEAPDLVWCGDMTEIETGEGKLYLATVIDLFSRRLPGYAMGTRHDAELVVAALHMAATTRGGDVRGVIFHTDRGSEFGSWAFTQRARASGLLPSMGSIGDCVDNAMMESFWARVQVELLNRRRWRTRLELSTALFEYLEIFHNRQRRHSALGMLSPVEYELRTPPVA